MKLESAKALVTGGSAGIGLETARALAQRGADVVICGRDGDRLDRAAGELGCLGVRADVSQEGDVDRLFERAIAGMGGLDVVINNAGFGYFAPLVDLDVARAQAVLATNLVGAMMVGRAAARHFVAQERGSIVNVGSTAARRGFPRGTAYAASKFALAGMTECWRAELRPHDVRVMQIDPSEVQTGFGGGEPGENPKKLRSEEIAHAIVAMLEMDDRGFIPGFEVWATNPR
jgi:3-oxoacyl-[acyl-carrier protein] reductase